MSRLFGVLEVFSFCFLFLVCLWCLREAWTTGIEKAVIGWSGTAQAWLGLVGLVVLG